MSNHCGCVVVVVVAAAAAPTFTFTHNFIKVLKFKLIFLEDN